ncbi:MAG: YvgY protein [Candidatus Woesebacteria bacterium GW2011_GWA1_39_21]|uniref:YvgY protein n=1 Tax=Candidatus Woesebacteria bacterium GW2011_GWA1_39_21 TaxID=1618550 RepID=A0A0G0N5X2_9BACT|nr:MAG: YvgY protein [Candidatus Woesebacteria bacterium GW2011_GWA1_39_21]
MQRQTIKLSGLTCPACKKVTEKRIGSLSGVIKVEVSLDSGVATIDADNAITILKIRKVLKDTPYQVVEK